MKVKASSWFAAGPEVSRALLLLSDGAFRLYFYVCLNANRENGCLTISYLSVARALAKSRRSIAAYFKELRRTEVCLVRTAVNQRRDSEIEICDDFWPYTRLERSLKSSDNERYLLGIRSLLDARACVR